MHLFLLLLDVQLSHLGGLELSGFSFLPFLQGFVANFIPQSVASDAS
jgi:hypothetical protein